jgi:hypothetical protein
MPDFSAASSLESLATRSCKRVSSGIDAAAGGSAGAIGASAVVAAAPAIAPTSTATAIDAASGENFCQSAPSASADVRPEFAFGSFAPAFGASILVSIAVRSIVTGSAGASIAGASTGSGWSAGLLFDGPMTASAFSVGLSMSRTPDWWIYQPVTVFGLPGR